MPPRLRGISSLFCVVGITNLAYWLGACTYATSYAVHTEELEHIEMIMFLVCMFGAILSFIGFAVLFFDCSHFCCVLIYGIPLALVVPALSCVGLAHINRIDKTATVTGIEMEVKSFWKEYGHSPSYLTKTEMDLECCGLHGPTDYREFIYGQHCQSQKTDVSFSCCNLSKLFTQGRNLHTKFCHVVANQDFFYFNYNDGSSCPNPDDSTITGPTSLSESDKRAQKCGCINNGFRVKKQLKTDIYQRGCIHEMIYSTISVKNIHFAFFLVLPALTMILLGVFLHAWSKAPPDVAAELHPDSAQRTSSVVTIVHPRKTKGDA